jgi:hypothetical protein
VNAGIRNLAHEDAAAVYSKPPRERLELAALRPVADDRQRHALGQSV